MRVPHDGHLMTPTLVYLHGIGAEHDDAWRDVMSAALVDVGYPGLFEGVECCAPKYPHTLRYPSDENHDPIRLPMLGPVSHRCGSRSEPQTAQPAAYGLTGSRQFGHRLRSGIAHRIARARRPANPTIV